MIRAERGVNPVYRVKVIRMNAKRPYKNTRIIAERIKKLGIGGREGVLKRVPSSEGMVLLSNLSLSLSPKWLINLFNSSLSNHIPPEEGE